jgi:hypothetical protein
MTDNQLIQLFLPIIQAGLIADGYPEVVVKQNNQPTQQGIDTAPTVYFSKISNRPYGTIHRENIWNGTIMQLYNTQWCDTTWQIAALVLQDPTNIDTYTASDLVNEIKQIMQSDDAINTLIANGVGILRIEETSNPYFKDDRDQFEAIPAINFTLNHLQTRIVDAPVLESIGLEIFGV